MKIISLQNSHQTSIRSFLHEDPVSNLYLLDLLDRQGVDYWGMHRWTAISDDDGKLIALNVDIACIQPNSPCKLSVPVGDPIGCKILGQLTASKGGCERIMAERIAADAFYEGMGKPKTRIFYNELLLWNNTIPTEECAELEPATKEDLEQLIEYTALMRVEDEGFDPRERDLALWQKTVAVLISQQRILVHKQNNAIAFVIEIGTRCARGVQIGSTYVPPQFRKQGIATRGMRAIVQHALQKSTFVSLLVHEENIPAMKTYQRTGWKHHSDYRVIEMDLF